MAGGGRTMRYITTPSGPARVAQHGEGPGLLVLGHGAGAGLDSPDLAASRAAALAAGWGVAEVEQPWLVAGRRVAEAPPRLDAAWLAVLEALAFDGPLVVGGRSAGARVACRTAAAVGADAVLALAFPLRPPRGRRCSRAHELAAVTVPLLIVQGERDAFGVPQDAVVIEGADHGFRIRRTDPAPGPRISRLVEDWLRGLAGQTLT